MRELSYEEHLLLFLPGWTIHIARKRIWSNRQKTKSQPKVDEHFTKAIVQTNGLTILAISEDPALIELTFTSLHTMFILGDRAEHVMAD